ncbi:uncharacterized protein tasor2 isoform X3 [Labeo rohita]|uniref:uncharacterized protein tasor2 isoform X3 n=1 Tax=Labeo rohita TaxID=84645 RepID=UPI0021E252C4|nr:uncharacterized protein tasor2 isoform X3 [Labeo rohita]
MENEITRSTEGLLEPVHPGSVTFNESILAPLHNNYLYEESKECFTYNSAHLINNGALQKRYAAFRSEKREKGYSEQELEESFGFLLFDDADRAKTIGETGLLVGRAKCTTLGDSSKGVYISKYADCLDLKRWYDGKTGYIVLLKLTKGRVKEVTDNYTQNFTSPTAGYDCHISDQLGAVSSTTSSFLAYERTQYYIYELCDGSSEIEKCPRHACPFAIVAFSYGKMSTTSELEQKSFFSSQDKTVFLYQPWSGQFKIESAVYDVGLQSSSGAWFPAKLPKTVKIDHAIGVSELKRTLPREIFETCIVGEVCIGGRCFNLYDVVSSKAKNDLAQIAQELKQKDMALVIPLEDSGFLILLHSSHLFSYEDAKSGKAAALQGMFIFPDSRTVPRDAKTDLQNTKVSTEIMQVIPALNYAETEMEKSLPNQQGPSQISLEKHLQDYGTLFHPGLLDVPTREASMFPDQYDVPGGFTLISPKWSKEAGTRLKSYFDEPCGFTIPVGRALELLTSGRQQRGDDHDDDVYYYISSPEEVPQTEVEVTKQSEAICNASDRTAETVERQKDELKPSSTEQPQTASPERLGKLGTAVVTAADSVLEYPTSTVSPKLGDVPTENCVSIENDVEKTSQGSTKGDAGGDGVDLSTKETPIQTRSTRLIKSTEEGATAASGETEDTTHPVKTKPDPDKKVNRRSLSRRRVNSPEEPMKDQIKTETVLADDTNPRRQSTRRGKGRRQRGGNRNLSKARQAQEPLISVTTETIDDQSIKNEMSPSKRDWRSLPRRKRLWNTDVSLKRSLRSDAVKNDEETTVDVQHNETKQSLSSTPKRKMEGLNLRERYGLKTIITNCGRVFVPHGSDVDAESAKKEKMHVEMSIDTNAETISPVENKSKQLVESTGESPSMGKEELPSKNPLVNDDEDSDSTSNDMPSALLSALRILRKLHNTHPSESDKTQDLCPEKSTPNGAVGVQQNNKDHPVAVQADATSSVPGVSDQSVHMDPKVSSPDKIKKKSKHEVYSAISISKLKTVLRRGKRVKSPSPGDSAKTEPDNAEPESKKGKLATSMDPKCDTANNELKDKESQPVNDEAQPMPMKSVEVTKQHVSWRGLIHKASKENGSLNFDTSAPFEIAKHADQQLISSLIGDRVGKRRISTDGKASAERLGTGASLPSDALSLLADLALGASNDKMLTNLEAKAGQEALDGVKATGSPESVLHALLRYPSARFKLPPRSPFPEGLLVTGELILEISKEHSYSQPTSPLSGLSGPSPKVSSPPSGIVESPLSLKTGLHLNLPKDAVASSQQEEGGKAEWKRLISPNKQLPEILKTKPRRSRILRYRSIIEKEGKIQVTRIWKEPYDFKFDSKFTNDSKDKTVSRALHGKWNFNIEDTYEDVHLIFHMWIGLFYSKPTSRLFHLENCNALPKEKEVEMVHLDINAIQNAVSLLNVDLSQKADSAKPVHASSEVLDLSVKNDEPANLRSVTNQSKRKDSASQPGETSSHKKKTGPRCSGTSLSSNPKVRTLMNYRSAMDVPVESSVPDNDNDTDDENYITTDCSYSQLLEKNSAYNQLCEKASNMRIGVRILQPKVRNVTNNKASTSITTSGQQKIGVFHQILSPIKPSAFSKPQRLVLGRKSFDLGLKNETGHVLHAVPQKGNVSDCAESKKIFEAKKDVCPEAVVDENVDKTLELKTGASILVQEESVSVAEESKVMSEEDSQDGCLTIMEDGNVEEDMSSETPSQDQTNTAEHKETAHAKEDLNPLLDLTDHTNMVDESRDTSSHETNVEETSNATEEPKPDTSLDDHVDELSDISSDEARVEELNETSNTNEELKLVPDLKDHTNMADELKDAISEEASIEECNEFSNAKEELDLKDQSSHEVDASFLKFEGNNTKEPVEEKEGYTSEEIMQENDFNSKDEANLVGSDTEHETSTEMEDHLDDFALVLEDDINSVDMEFSDEDSETKVQVEVYEQNSSNDKSSAFIDDDHDEKIQKSEKQPQTLEEANLEEDTLEESSKGSCPGEDQLMSVQEKHTAAANNDTSDVMHDESETRTVEQSIVVQQEALDVCQDESKPTDTVEHTKIDISHLEKGDERDLSQQDASEFTDDALVNENETQSQGSCKDQISETYQDCLSLKICASPPNTTTDSHNEAVAPQALTINKPSEVDVSSMCSTPTQDEISCYPEVNKAFREEDLNKELYNPEDTDHTDMKPPKSPVSSQPHVFTQKPLSDFKGHHEEIHNDELRWKRKKYPGTMDFKDKSAITTEHSPSEDSLPLKHKLYPASQQKDDETCNFIEGASQNDSELYYGDDSHGYYHRSDENIQWHDYQTEEPVDDQLYHCENDSGGNNDQPGCSKHITSEWEYSYKHKKRAQEETDDYCWGEKNYKSDPFKYPIKVTCTADYETEIGRSSKKKSRKRKFHGAFCQNAEWDDEDFSESRLKTSYFETYQTKPTRSVIVSSLPHDKPSKQHFDWRRYFRREVTCSQLLDASERDNKFDIPPSSIVTILDRKGNRVTFNNSPTMKPSFDGSSLTEGLEDSFNDWQEQQSKADVTRSAIDLEYLIFSENITRVLKETKNSVSTTSHCRSNPDPALCPMTVRFSNLSEVDSSVELSKAQSSLTDFKIKVDMSDRKEKNRQPHLQRLFCEKGSEVEFSGISEITEQCAVAYKSMMNDVCSGKTLPRPTETRKRKFGRKSIGCHPGLRGRIKKDVFDSPHDNLKTIVRQASKTKYRFYILVTSTDTFFEETKNLLEIEGHIPVKPDEFDLNGDDQSPLLIVLRNEDIADHICEVPHLLELKKSPSVVFAGIDRPDDVVNLTHQELFAKGGFIVCDELALDTLTLDDMKKVVGILEELDKQGKWKWFLHYRDSRRLRENARSSPEASKKQQFIDCCQKAGVIEVLPYHDCDVMSRERPDYLFCLTRLQIQNASVRFPVFITDTPTESFGTNGILTMNIYTFSRILSNDTCSVS